MWNGMHERIVLIPFTPGTFWSDRPFFRMSSDKGSRLADDVAPP